MNIGHSVLRVRTDLRSGTRYAGVQSASMRYYVMIWDRARRCWTRARGPFGDQDAAKRELIWLRDRDWKKCYRVIEQRL